MYEGVFGHMKVNEGVLRYMKVLGINRLCSATFEQLLAF